MKQPRPSPLALAGLMSGALSALSTAALAHPEDQYVQSTYLILAPTHAAVELHLTAGTLLGAQVLGLIDVDKDGRISEAEEQAYASAVLQDLTVQVDGEARPLTVTRRQFPPPDNVGTGGEIRLDMAVEGLPSTEGAHQLVFENRHQPGIGAYMANAFVQKRDELKIVKQQRDSIQHHIQVDYVVTRGAPAPVEASAADSSPGLPRWLVLVGLGVPPLLGALLFWRLARGPFWEDR